MLCEAETSLHVVQAANEPPGHTGGRLDLLIPGFVGKDLISDLLAVILAQGGDLTRFPESLIICAELRPGGQICNSAITRRFIAADTATSSTWAFKESAQKNGNIAIFAGRLDLF